MKIILIDNYDSFTFNLYHYLSTYSKVDVVRNDKINSLEIIKKKYNKIVISPGPGNPNQAGNCLNIVKSLYKKIPILGVCLGHQIIGQVFGSKIIQAKKLVHGKISTIISSKKGILKNLPNRFEATRYHSLIIEKKTLSIDLEITATVNKEDEVESTDPIIINAGNLFAKNLSRITSFELSVKGILHASNFFNGKRFP